MLIDVHAHQYPDAYLDAVRRPESGLEHYIRDDGRLVVLQDGAVALAVPQPQPSVEQRIALMDAAGIRVQALSIPAPNVYRLPLPMRVDVTRQVNDEHVAIARQHPGRFVVLASLPLPDVDAAMAEIARTSTMPEVAGVALCSTIDRRTLDDPDLAPVFTALAETGRTVFVHPTTACCTEGIRDYALSLGIDFLAETTLAIARLTYSGCFDRYDGINWIFAHLGGATPFLLHRFDNYFRQFPECREHIDSAPSTILKRVFFDTVSTHPPAMQCAFDSFGAEQFVFGTDYPHVPGGLDVFIETLGAVELDADARSAVEHRTAARLLGIDLTTIA